MRHAAIEGIGVCPTPWPGCRCGRVRSQSEGSELNSIIV